MLLRTVASLRVLMSYSLPADRVTVEVSYLVEEMIRRDIESGAASPERPKIVHSLHGGVYTRTAKIPAGSMITSALIKIETTLLVHGDFSVLRVEDGSPVWDQYRGAQVFAAAAGRRMVYACESDVVMTMIFPTSVTTVADAEAQFTDEIHLLQSFGGEGDVVINTHKEPACQA